MGESMKTKSMYVLFAAALLAGCGKDDGKSGGGGGGSCPPLEVTIDGTKVEGLSHGLALDQEMSGEVIHVVEVFNHDQVTCEQVLSKAGRQTGPDEIAIRGSVGGSFGNGLGIDSTAQMGADVDVKLAGKAGSKPGDTVTMCVAGHTLEPKVGAHKGKKVTIKGALSGTYCGVMK